MSVTGLEAPACQHEAMGSSEPAAVAPRAGDEDMLTAFAAHLHAQRGLSEHTVRGYRGDVISLLATLPPAPREHESDLEISDLGRLDLPALRHWLAGLSGRGQSRASIARRAAAARTFTAWAARTGRLAIDPGPRLLAPKADKVIPHILTEAEAATLLDTAAEAAKDGDAVATRDWAALELLYAAGLRISELVGLDLPDVDFGERLVRVLGKGARERMVPFGVPAAAALQQWLIRRDELASAHAGAALFLGVRGRRVDPRQIRAAV